MEDKEKIIESIKMLESNKPELAKTFCNELREIGMPFMLAEDGYPIVSKDLEDFSVKIYHSICAKFLYKNNK